MDALPSRPEGKQRLRAPDIKRGNCVNALLQRFERGMRMWSSPPPRSFYIAGLQHEGGSSTHHHISLQIAVI